VGSYYYLVAQLPHLVYGQDPPMTTATFKALAMQLLSESDAALFGLVDLNPCTNDIQASRADTSRSACADDAPASGSGFVDGWREWELALRLNLARHRSQKAKRDVSVFVNPPFFPATAHAAAAKAAMMAMDSPLEAEFVLDKARWDAIEELQGTDYFGRNTVFAYLLKLMLLERRASFNADEGYANYKSLYASILDSAEKDAQLVGEAG
jgi:hypothetical protein